MNKIICMYAVVKIGIMEKLEATLYQSFIHACTEDRRVYWVTFKTFCNMLKQKKRFNYFIEYF